MTLGAYIIGGGSGVPYHTFTETIQVQSGSSSTTSKTVDGSNLSSLAWLQPDYVSVSGTDLITLQDDECIDNNASTTLPTSDIAINVTYEITAGEDPYCAVGLGYGTTWPAGDTGNYQPGAPYDSAGIMLYLEHGAMSDYQLFVFYNGALYANVSVGSISANEDIGLGFEFESPNVLYVFYYNGTIHTYKFTPEEQTSKGFSPKI